MGPMHGVKVIEIGLWVAGPSCGGVLADWGAEVIKIEPLAGDPFRSMEATYGGVNPPFELDNRGKHSVALDITTEDGLAIVHQLLAEADVLLTNYRPGGLERAGLDYETVAARHPKLIYAHVSGYGLQGEDRDRAAYDMGAFYGRAGIAAALTPDGADLPYPRGGMGDHMTGMAAAGGVAAALFNRSKTGKGELVSTSLLRNGVYMHGWDHNVTARLGTDSVPQSRRSAANPQINGYRCGDGKWLWLLGLEGERHWPGLVAALDQPQWNDDPRFATFEQRQAHAAELVAALDEVLMTKSRDEWAVLLDRHEVWWAKVQTGLEVRADPQVRAAGCYVDAPLLDGEVVEMVASPVDFGTEPWAVREPAPELGQHTELVLMDLGIDWDRIEQLKDRGVIP